MKLRNVLFFSFLVCASPNTQAAFIDNGGFTTDTSTGLDWLDLTATNGIAFNDAELLNPGWHYADNYEVSGLFESFFNYPGVEYAPIMPDLTQSSSTGTISLDADITQFENLFGVTQDNTETASLGMFMSYVWLTPETQFPAVFGTLRANNYLYTIRQEGNHPLVPQLLDVGTEGVGIYLVRTSVVPVPAAAWLFGSGLIGLVGLARRKKA